MTAEQKGRRSESSQIRSVLPLTVCFTRNTSALIRLTDFLGRQRHEVVQAMKIKKPLAKDCVVFPTYNLEGIAPLPFQHCWALLKEVIDLQKKRIHTLVK